MALVADSITQRTWAVALASSPKSVCTQLNTLDAFGEPVELTQDSSSPTVAQQYPNCEVTGVDQTPKEHQYVPDNLRYHQANYEAAEEDGEHPAWSYPPLQDADLIFFRECAPSIVGPEKLISNVKR